MGCNLRCDSKSKGNVNNFHRKFNQTSLCHVSEPPLFGNLSEAEVTGRTSARNESKQQLKLDLRRRLVSAVVVWSQSVKTRLWLFYGGVKRRERRWYSSTFTLLHAGCCPLTLVAFASLCCQFFLTRRECGFTFTALLFFRVQQPRRVKRGKAWGHQVKCEQAGEVDLNLQLLCSLFHRAYSTRLCASIKILCGVCMLGEAALWRPWPHANYPTRGHLCKGAALATPEHTAFYQWGANAAKKARSQCPNVARFVKTSEQNTAKTSLQAASSLGKTKPGASSAEHAPRLQHTAPTRCSPPSHWLWSAASWSVRWSCERHLTRRGGIAGPVAGPPQSPASQPDPERMWLARHQGN